MQRSAFCRSRRELSNEYLVAKIGFDTAENEPCKVCPLSVYRSPRSSHAMISVILRIMFTAKLTGFLTTVPSDRIAMLKKCDVALVLFGTVWNGLGLLSVFAWPSNEAAALRHAVVLYGFSTFIAYPVEVYIFYWRVIAFHENVAHISDLFTLPRNAWNDGPQKKRGSPERAFFFSCRREERK